MTRLRKEDVMHIRQNLFAYDANLVRKTGLPLKEIARYSTGVSEGEMTTATSSRIVAVVPITSGQGVVENFTGAVEGILVHIGVNAFITASSDVAGLAEGIEKGADIVFLADDNRFIALNLPSRRIIDNVEATAKGFVSALDAMAGGLSRREVLVIGGAGCVGWNAVLALEDRGAKVAVLDLNQEKVSSLVIGHEITVERNMEEALSRYTVFFDASPAANIIQVKHITPETFIAAPGVPLGLSEEAYRLVRERLIHDVLEIGVATMFVQASCN